MQEFVFRNIFLTKESVHVHGFYAFPARLIAAAVIDRCRSRWPFVSSLQLSVIEQQLAALMITSIVCS